MTPTHQNYPIPSSEKQSEFALRLYFGAGNPRELVVQRAYLDMCRTAKGIGKFKDSNLNAFDYLTNAIVALPGSTEKLDQNSFDVWHETTCDELCRIFHESGYESFCIGHAQKWINMSLKYLYVFGEIRAPGFHRFYQYCHVPIDNVILGHREFKGLRSFSERWSRISEYSKYIEFQKAIREHFKDFMPPAVEFWVWQRENST